MIKVRKVVLLLVIMAAASSVAFGDMPTIDLTVNKSIVDVVKETSKAATNTKDILQKSKETVNVLGNKGEIYTSGLDWINGSGRLANQALNSCGMRGMIPDFKLDWPGLDLGNVDMSCLSSAQKFVEDAYFKVKNVKPDDLAKMKLRPGQSQKAKVIENRRELFENSTKMALASSLRRSQQAGQTSADILKKSMDYKKEKSAIELTRFQISVQLQILDQLSELNGQFATYNKMMASQLMIGAGVKLASEDKPWSVKPATSIIATKQ